MRAIGILLWALGTGLFVYAAFVFDPSVQSFSGYGPGRIGIPDRIVNLDRQQTQMLLAMAGLTLFLAGVLVHALSVVALVRAQPGEPRSAPPGHAPKPRETPGNVELMAQHGIRAGDDGAQV
jgi:hypothetical protein